MNLEHLYTKIKNPNQLDAGDVNPLKELCVKYPFSQLFSILYLKALAQSKNLHFEDEIQMHAFKITDRVKLYDLIQSHEGLETNEASDNVVHETEEELPEVENITELPEIKIVFETETEVIQEEEVVEEQEVPEAEDKPKEAVLEDETVSEDFAALEKEFLAHAIGAAYSLELEEKDKAENPTEEKDLPTGQVGKINIHENRSFSAWLKVSSSEEKASQKESDKIIEKFIQEEPERIKPKKDFYSAPKKAKESISDDNLIYTETLANIYALQGNFPKAITAFQYLMLTMPEKKLYFAKKLEELNKKINS